MLAQQQQPFFAAAPHTVQKTAAPVPTCPTDAEKRQRIVTFGMVASLRSHMQTQISLARGRSQGTQIQATPNMVQRAETAIRAELGTNIPADRHITDPAALTMHDPVAFGVLRAATAAAARRRIALAALEHITDDLAMICITSSEDPILLDSIAEVILQADTISFVQSYEAAKFGGQTTFNTTGSGLVRHIDIPLRSRNMGHIIVHEAMHFYVNEAYRSAAETHPALTRILMEGGAEFLARHVIHSQLASDPDFRINYATYGGEFSTLADHYVVHRGGLGSFLLMYFQGRTDLLGL